MRDAVDAIPAKMQPNQVKQKEGTGVIPNVPSYARYG
jgi:hypothetical protein